MKKLSFGTILLAGMLSIGEKAISKNDGNSYSSELKRAMKTVGKDIKNVCDSKGKGYKKIGSGANKTGTYDVYLDDKGIQCKHYTGENKMLDPQTQNIIRRAKENISIIAGNDDMFGLAYQNGKHTIMGANNGNDQYGIGYANIQGPFVFGGNITKGEEGKQYGYGAGFVSKIGDSNFAGGSWKRTKFDANESYENGKNDKFKIFAGKDITDNFSARLGGIYNRTNVDGYDIDENKSLYGGLTYTTDGGTTIDVSAYNDGANLSLTIPFDFSGKTKKGNSVDIQRGIMARNLANPKWNSRVVKKKKEDNNNSGKLPTISIGSDTTVNDTVVLVDGEDTSIDISYTNVQTGASFSISGHPDFSIDSNGLISYTGDTFGNSSANLKITVQNPNQAPVSKSFTVTIIDDY